VAGDDNDNDDDDDNIIITIYYWCWRRMEKISWTAHVRNEEVLLSQGAEEYAT
jgi:hypothetical protein